VYFLNGEEPTNQYQTYPKQVKEGRGETSGDVKINQQEKDV
jgi:hypothetical protein